MSNTVVRDIGPCIVEFNSVDLGKTYGGVKIKFEEEVAPVQHDQQGSIPVDQISTGLSVEAEVPLADFTLATMATITPGATGSGTDVASGTPVSGRHMTVKNAVGASKYASAHQLILKPIVENGQAAAKSSWIRIFKAAPRVSAELMFDADGQRIYNVVFTGFPDQTASKPVWRMWAIGSGSGFGET